MQGTGVELACFYWAAPPDSSIDGHSSGTTTSVIGALGALRTGLCLQSNQSQPSLNGN